jgi:hypothetical protein
MRGVPLAGGRTRWLGALGALGAGPSLACGVTAAFLTLDVCNATF